MRFVETYSEVIIMNIYDGVLEAEFVCGQIIPLCSDTTYENILLKQDMEDVIEDYKTNFEEDEFVNNLYANAVGSPVTKYVLHLSDLNIDSYYVPGASVSCREFRCCHAKNYMVPQSDPNSDSLGDDIAGPFGSRGCDQSLGGA